MAFSCVKAQPVSRVLSRMAIYPGAKSPMRSSDTVGTGRAALCVPESCTGWGLHDGTVARPPVRSYRTFPPLPFSRRYISVALALELPPPAVSWHPALRCPDFPHALRHAAIQLPLNTKRILPYSQAFVNHLLPFGVFASTLRYFDTSMANSRLLRHASF